MCLKLKTFLKLMLLCVLLLGGILILAGSVFAATVNLGWDANTESDLDGYKLYYGQTPREDGAYTTVVVIDDETATTHSLPDMAVGTWYFSLTAYDTSGNESDFSNEVNATIDDPEEEIYLEMPTNFHAPDVR